MGDATFHNVPMIPAIDLQSLREELEGIDREILNLLKRRMKRVEDVAKVKLDAAVPFRDQQREERVLKRVRRIAVETDLDPHGVERIYRRIMEMSIAHQQAHVQSLDTVPLRIAYQGVEGSYSHLTAQRRYARRRGGALLTGFESFYAAGKAVREGSVDIALLPIENSTAGSINQTYDILSEGGLTITAETVSHVLHCLIGIPGSTIEGLRTVISHPQALAQCDIFLHARPQIRTLAEFDTAGAARKVKEANDPTLAAIASQAAAEMSGLKVLARGIQNHPHNATRFVEIAIEAFPCPPDAPCKTSLMLLLDRDPVHLGEVLNAFGRRAIPLAKLESRPIPSKTWNYRFYLDVEGHADTEKMVDALEEVRALTSELHILGTYPKAKDTYSIIEGANEEGEELEILW